MLFYGSTDVGMRRAVNQDNFIVEKYSDDVMVAVVCDGMGGAAGGSIASATATATFRQELRSAEEAHPLFAELDNDAIRRILVGAAEEANRAVYEKACADEALNGMGTTLVGCLVLPGRICVVNVGDSRLYMDRGEGLTQVTKDHSYVQYLVDMGKMTTEEARSSKRKNIITRAVGTEASVEIDFFAVDYADETRLLLCSDGLTNHVDEASLEQILRCAMSEESIQKACEEMISSANAKGGSDNITAVAIAIQSETNECNATL